MAKENEKKLSADMSSDELENVSGGWCSLFSTSKPKLQSNQTLQGDADEDNGYTIMTNYRQGQIGKASYDKKGNFVGGGIATCANGTTR